MNKKNKFTTFEYPIKNHEKYLEYEKKIEQKTNCSNFLLHKTNLEDLFELNEYEYFLAYCFTLLRKWIHLNERYTDEYIVNLDNIIKNNKLKNKLGSYELEYLNHIKAVVFAKKRNLKRLIVDFPLDKVKLNNRIFKRTESVFFNFNFAEVYEVNQKEKKSLIKDCEIYLSNFRIIINQISHILSIHYSNIHSYKLQNGLLRINVSIKNDEKIINKTYLLSCYDNYVLYVSFERMLQIWTKKYQ